MTFRVVFTRESEDHLDEIYRDDTRPGLRTTSYRKRTIVAYAILEDVVAVIGIFHGGRDYEAILRDDGE